MVGGSKLLYVENSGLIQYIRPLQPFLGVGGIFCPHGHNVYQGFRDPEPHMRFNAIILLYSK